MDPTDEEMLESLGRSMDDEVPDSTRTMSKDDDR